ncbi:ABC-type Fe3+/spermidine/putrescine transport systems, ATPase components [Mucilaginibacter lappiensis]|uniref:ABC-type sulfate/molybdate transport systems ATPase subunit n=1 Tax=Mucilaginibacter lappiensis TaxID=354630 RepID=A0ABR6PGN0_9SPHI|nr:ABC transporter ATP-binding protein [Mucilaginibacter lappiensis]MBB6108926.1 ABC-type sulfate/molybdate transport systems ATPase subunit [Mucilaginibacter lappiensis]SIQ68103.1 ABC-type Fe3+/spermidine/putrescine transport systems, ATPase components [Mucilaginibacter lappiensis]
MNNDLILETISVTKNFFGDKSSGVNNITIFIPKGKITAIVGESGSGKTTLLNLLYGHLQPDHGEVFFKEEQVLSRDNGLQHAHQVMRLVTQNGSDMDAQLSVWDTIAAGLQEEDKSLTIQKVTEVLNMLHIYQLKEQPFGKLSGGEKQRVTIAKALISRPEVLLLDEPFNQVDATYREGLQHDIRYIVKAWGVTVVLVSHDPAEILSMADELIVLKEGEIVENGSPEQLYHSPKLLYTSQILASCSQLTSTQAKVCGIKSRRGVVVIYAEHIKLGVLGNKWLVTQVLFKGFYEELIIEREGVILRVTNHDRGKYPKGTKISININKYFEFGKWEN